MLQKLISTIRKRIHDIRICQSYDDCYGCPYLVDDNDYWGDCNLGFRVKQRLK